MNISSKEKRLLCIVVAIALGVLYYKTLYKNNVEELQAKQLERDNIKNKYDKALAKINAIDDRKKELSSLKEVAVSSAKDYYPDIIQEKLIKEVEELMKKNNLTGDYSWGERKSEAVEDLTPSIISKSRSSLQVFADVIKADLGSSLQGLADNLNSEARSNSQTTNETSTPSIDATQNVTNENNENTSDVYPVQMKLTINFKGSYDALRSFVQDIKDYARVVSSSALSATWESENMISSGTIDIEFYSIPKINDDDNSYFSWN